MEYSYSKIIINIYTINNNCDFCKTTFPNKNQEIDDKLKYWTFIHDIKPICDFHCLIVLKKEVMDKIGTYINDISDIGLSEEILIELGILLNKACTTIKKCDKNIERVNIISLNSGEFSKHLHFNLIPIYKGEEVKKINDLNIDGGGLNFWSRKEIVQDTLDEFIKQTCGNKSNNILSSINQATIEKVNKNTEILKMKYN